MFDPRPLYCSSLTKTVGGTKDTNIVDSESPYRGTNHIARECYSALMKQKAVGSIYMDELDMGDEVSTRPMP